MNIRVIIQEFLNRNHFDGLGNPDVHCGCLAEDLAPCDLCENMMDCEPGHREDVDEHALCECDGQGEKHWHIVIPLPNSRNQGQLIDDGMLNQPHRCPVCNGQGLVSKPPWIAGDQMTWVSSSTQPWPCHTCGGMGVLWG